MKPERWRRVQALFEAVVELPIERRAAYLETACADDPTLREEVEKLVEADSEQGELLSSPAGAILAPLAAELFESELETPAADGQRIGPYRVIRPLGFGGMGAVYVAEREDIGLRCALKLVRGVLASPSRLNRFQLERRLLARLEHPNIARLLDAGVTDDGVPWFAMELVDGRPIDEYCDERRLPVPERVRLFARVCRAVAYAHRNLIVHRDLKPGNILVTATGEPKLLDFGIAKLLGEQDEEFTRAGEGPSTPGFAAPEQLTGGDVTTATDVYGLGVLLSILLSGYRPDPGADPIRPSAAASRLESPRRNDGVATVRTPEDIAAARATTVAQLRRQLAGDLDAIVLRALAAEPERRYGSAGELADDLQRHARGRPVEARPDTWTYRARRFVRRYRYAVSAAATFVILLGGFAGAMTVQQAATARERDRAEAARARADVEAAKARDVSEFLVDLFDGADPFSPDAIRADSISLRDFLILRGERVASLDGDPEIQLQALNVVGRMYMSQGLLDRARPLLQQARTLGRTLYPEGSGDIVAVLNNLARVEMEAGERDTGERTFRDALAMGRRVHTAPHRNVVSTLHGLGDLLGQKGEYEEAETLLRESLELRRTLYGDRSAEAGDGYNNLGLVLWRRGDLDSAAPMLQEALAICREQLPATHPTTSAVLNNLGLVLAGQGRLDAAESALREALEIKRRLFGAGNWRIANGTRNLASVLVTQGRYDEAEPLTMETLTTMRSAFGENHELIGLSLAQLGEIREGQGRLDEAERAYRDAVAAIRAVLPPDHPRQADSQLALGMLLLKRDRPTEAAPFLETAVRAFSERLGDEHPRTAAARAALEGTLPRSDRAAAGPDRAPTRSDDG